MRWRWRSGIGDAEQALRFSALLSSFLLERFDRLNMSCTLLLRFCPYRGHGDIAGLPDMEFPGMGLSSDEFCRSGENGDGSTPSGSISKDPVFVAIRGLCVIGLPASGLCSRLSTDPCVCEDARRPLSNRTPSLVFGDMFSGADWVLIFACGAFARWIIVFRIESLAFSRSPSLMFTALF